MIDPFRSRTCALREFLNTPGRLCVIRSLSLGTLLGDADPRVPQLWGEAVIATGSDRSTGAAGIILTLESYHLQFFGAGWHTTRWYLDLEELPLFTAALAPDLRYEASTSPYAEEIRLITQDGCLLRVNDPVIQIGTCQRFDGRNGEHATWTLCPFREQLENLQCLLEPGITWLNAHAPKPVAPPVHRPKRRSPYPASYASSDTSLYVQ